MSSFSRKEFLEALFNDYFSKRDGFIMVRTGKHLDPRVSTRYFPNIEILSKEPYQEDQNVFFGVCPRESMKPEQRHVRYVTALWAGLDLNGDGYSGKDLYFLSKPLAAKAVRSFPLPPSIVVESGVGMHLYWLLQDIVEIENVQSVENCLNEIGSHFQCKTPSRVDAVLRLPGTTNCKVTAQGAQCRVKFINADFRYSLEDFERLSLTNRHAATPTSAQPHRQEVATDKTIPSEGRSDERQVDDTEDLFDFLSPSESAAKHEPVRRPAPAKSHPHESTAGARRETKAAARHEFEPLPYENSFELTEESMKPAPKQPPVKPAPGSATMEIAEDEFEVIEEQSLDAMADKIVDGVVEKLSGRLMDVMVDKIVEKLALELTVGSRPRK